MRVQQSGIRKFFQNPVNGSYLQTASENNSVSGARNFAGWIRNVISLKRSGSESVVFSSAGDVEVANREVHLDGYATHEEVVRAYLAFAGIDPDSKEARLYFEL